MGKIKKWYRSIPIWLALCLFIALALLISSFISGRITSLFSGLAMEIQFKYATRTQPDGDDPGNGDIIYEIADGSEDGMVEISLNYDHYSDEDWQAFQRYSFIATWSPLFLYSLCILAAILLFYFTKLKTPMKMLTRASSKIADNELDFSLDYAGRDEMAKLCAAFEKMCTALDENNRQMLHMIDERGQLNDAYTHDLRTPIAVLKGYTDMMAKYLPAGKMPQEEVLETVKTMSAHVARLEQFVDSMNTVQKLEDVSIQKETVSAQEFLDHLRESAKILCRGRGLSCKFLNLSSVPADSDCDGNQRLDIAGGGFAGNRCMDMEASACNESRCPAAAGAGESLHLDPAVVLQVYENLMGNAVRFAKSEVTVSCSVTEDAFSISVTDDGRGFSGQDLRKAMCPYYSRHHSDRLGKIEDFPSLSHDTQKREYHFGLGLHICRILCEKHGGSLCLENAPAGGACVTARFSTSIAFDK